MRALARAVNILTGRLAFVLVVIAAGGIVAACSGIGSDGTQNQSTVTADMFSGRANPVWMLSTDGAQQLENLLGGLATADREPPTFAQLGFRRFSVSDVRSNGVSSTVSVTPDIVVLDGTGTVLSDPEDLVYTFLWSEAERELSPEDFGAIPEPS